MSDKPFGLDVSRWDGQLDWDIIAANTEPLVCFVGIRATVSWGYVDSWFQRNWIESKRVGIPRAAYHVLHPNTSAEKQISSFLSTLGNDFGELPLVLDVELDQGITPSKIETALLRSATIIKQNTGQSPIIYSRATFVDYYITAGGTPPEWLNDFDWWLAHYLKTGQEHPGPPPLPKGVIREKCIIHQTSDQGIPFGAESKSVDYNRWQFDLNHLKKYIGENYTPTLEEKIEILWKAHPELH